MTDILDDFIKMEKEFESIKDGFSGFSIDLRLNPKKGPQSSAKQPEVWDPEKYIDSVGITYKQCVYSKCVDASCSKCADACPSDAIGFKNDHIWILRDKCIGCGLCAGVCPTGAFTSTRCKSETFYEEVCAAAATGETAYVTCYKALNDLPQAGVKVVPCLGVIPADLWFAILVDYPNLAVYLPDDICSSCAVSTGETVYGSAIATAEIWSHRGLGFEVDESELKLDMKRSVARKEFIDRMLKRSVKLASVTNVATAGVFKAYEKFQEGRAKIANLQKQLSNIVASAQVEQVITPAHKIFLAALDRHPQLADSLYLPICRSTETCTLCEQCITGCPMGARKKVNGEIRTIVSYCTGCKVCEDICENEGCIVMRTPASMAVRELDKE